MSNKEDQQCLEDMSFIEKKAAEFSEFVEEMGMTPGELFKDPGLYGAVVGSVSHDHLPQEIFELLLANELKKVSTKDSNDLAPTYVRRAINLGYTKEDILKNLKGTNEFVVEVIVNAFEYITTSLKMDIAPLFPNDIELFVPGSEDVQIEWKLDKLFLEYSIIHNINRGKDLPEILDIYHDDPLYCDAVKQVYYDLYWRALIYMMKTKMTEEMFHQNYPDL